MPTSQTVGGHDSYWTFDPPIGDVFRVTMDARLEPAQQYGKSATTAFLIKGVPIVRVHYTTVVFP